MRRRRLGSDLQGETIVSFSRPTLQILHAAKKTANRRKKVPGWKNAIAMLCCQRAENSKTRAQIRFIGRRWLAIKTKTPSANKYTAESAAGGRVGIARRIRGKAEVLAKGGEP